MQINFPSRSCQRICKAETGAVDRHSHSASDTLYGIFPYFVSVFTILFWIASNTSVYNKDE